MTMEVQKHSAQLGGFTKEEEPSGELGESHARDMEGGCLVNGDVVAEPSQGSPTHVEVACSGANNNTTGHVNTDSGVSVSVPSSLGSSTDGGACNGASASQEQQVAAAEVERRQPDQKAGGKLHSVYT